MEYFGAEEDSGGKLAGTVLVMPAISIGNVGQLAVDLIITSLHMKRVGVLEEPNVLPCTGNDAVGGTPEGIMSTSLEVFQSASASITVIQQRAPFAPGRLKAFAQNLSDWVRQTAFADVVILSGLAAGKQLGGHALPEQRVRYIAHSKNHSQRDTSTSAEAGPKVVAFEKRCQELGWHVLEDFTAADKGSGPDGENGHQEESSGPATSLGNGGSYGSMFGVEGAEAVGSEGGQWWGLGKAYQGTAFWKMSEALKDQGVGVLSLLLLCSEGDNVPDGLALASALDSLLEMRSDTKQGSGPGGWDIPASWASIYGPPPDTSLFG